MASLGQDVDPTKPAGNFGMGVQQMIEIAKAVLINAKMIIMDEPTSSLGEKEVEQLMKTCRELKARGIGIVFVSHKLEELFELCDRVEVIRDGEFIATKPIDQWDNDSLITAMVGRSLDNQFPKEFGEKSKEPMLEVDNVVEAGVLNNVSFKAYGGQIPGALQVWSAPVVPRSCAQYSAQIRSTAARSRSRARKYISSPRVRRSITALRSSPRTVRDRVWYWLRPFAPT